MRACRPPALGTRLRIDDPFASRVRTVLAGRPLELDTDGIWCTLPASFPENFVFKFALDPQNPADKGKKSR